MGSDGGSLNSVYPVGSIYLSVNSTNPSTLFGGTWVQLEDRFLLGAGSTYTAGSTGGSATHTLTLNEIPAHSHNYTAMQKTSSYPQFFNSGNSEGGYIDNITSASTNSGGSQAHNNMPPYLVVYMWKRTA